jgi:uridine phosphorylase
MPTREKLSATELILNEDGGIYHLSLKPENLAETIILVGDPKRVEIISGYFNKIEYKGFNREIHTHTGVLNNKRITVMSTGMGTDNIDIVLNEINALVNIDLENRVIKDHHTELNIIRLGTSGAIQPDIPLNSYILSEFGLGMDGMLTFYRDYNTVNEASMVKEFIDHTGWKKEFPYPYIVKASEKLVEKLGKGLIKGITATAPGFYGPQGRELVLPATDPELNKKFKSFRYFSHRIVNFEMETSALYGLGKLLGHNTLTVCCAIANRDIKEYNQNYKKAIIGMIEMMLERITAEV